MTVALSMIVKDELAEVTTLLAQAENYFDEINVVVSDAETFDKLRDNFNHAPFNFKYRKWNDKFDEARNASLEMCTTDYMFWLDADDSFDFSTIPELVDIAEENDIDAIFMPYNYMQDEQGNCITRHWRERLVKLNKGYSWRGWVHETCITDEPTMTHKIELEVKHNATIDDAKNSYERNHKILEVAYAETKDPRYLHYLGMSYFTKKDYRTAAGLMSDYLEVGGSIEDIYRTLGLLSECAYHLGKYDEALEYATKCTTLKPQYPMGYWLLAQYEADQDHFEEALEWVRVSETKPDPETLSVWDPSSRARATLIAARSLFMLHRYTEALAELRKIRDMPEVQSIYKDFLDEADAEVFISVLPKMRKFFKSDGALWNALTDDIKYDTRIQPLRFSVNEPKEWSEDSIVIFCGQGYEEWGPHTLDKGMGGSEEAVVYLSKELSKLGYNVTVYAEADGVTDEGTDQAVFWRHWKKIDTRDKFNIFVSWRAPQYIERIDAKVKLVDVHDVLPKDIVKNYPDVTYLVKSQYHSDLLPEDVDREVIGNGIAKEQFV
jgi:tetratricopeptide (TPR) repeat protein